MTSQPVPLAKLGGAVGQTAGSQPVMSTVIFTGSFRGFRRPGQGSGINRARRPVMLLPSLGLAPDRLEFSLYLLLATDTFIKQTPHTRNNPNPIVCFS